MEGSCCRLKCVKLRIGYITFPVDTRRCFNVVRRRIKVETTSSVYRDSFNNFYNNTFVAKPISTFSSMKNNRLMKSNKRSKFQLPLSLSAVQNTRSFSTHITTSTHCRVLTTHKRVSATVKGAKNIGVEGIFIMLQLWNLTPFLYIFNNLFKNFQL